MGKTIKRGQLVAGRLELSKNTGISEQSIRTSLVKLKSTSEITIKTTNKYSVISINNYDEYQQSTNKLTNNQPTTNQQLTTNEEYKKDNKEKKDIYSEFINYFNKATNKKYGLNKNNIPNFTFWSKTYSQNQMRIAIKLALIDDWWKDKLTPERLLRQRNANGVCDNIGDLLNKYEGKYELNQT